MSFCHFQDFFVTLFKTHELLRASPASSGTTAIVGGTAVVRVPDVAGWFTLYYQDMSAVAGALLLQMSVIFVFFLLQLSTLLLQGFCCCWSP
jgi:hypothetical protein